MTQRVHEPPTGFVELPEIGEPSFHQLCGPFWARADAGRLIGGFRVERRQCNYGGVCHGGMIATLCDVMISLGAHYQLRPGLFIMPTINLSVDFLAAIPLGAWVEARSDYPRATGRLVFGQTLLTVGGEPAARATAILRRGEPSPDGRDTGELLHAHLDRAA